MRKIRTLRSHAAHARYLAGCGLEPAGWIPRRREIPSPYASSPDHPVFFHLNDGRIIVVETRHRHYEVFSVAGEQLLSRPL